jgi:hypothetical protein
MKTFWRLALVATACNADQAAKCNLHCLNDGECQIGKADFSAHPTKFHGISLEMYINNEQNGYHCHCRPGYTGLRCGIKYQDCSDAGHACYNGGRCILGLSDIYGNDQLFCDCSTAIDENGTKYVGKYCEIPQTLFCEESGTFFCVNGGQCRPDYGNHPISPCICGSEYDGPHCEFEAGAVPECTLKCHNGGECRLGMKSELSSNGKILYDFWKNHSDYQYCECPTGFHGLQCEIKSSKCGMHHCFHGGECVTVNDGSTQKRFCDCSKAYSRVSSYAGEFCQYEADNVCDEKKTSNGQLFCVNGGVCRLDDSNLSCSCPKGYHGPICEFKDSNITNDFEDCNLVCANGGKCRNGAKDTSFWDKFGDALSHYSVSHDKNFEHCVCPEGFTGLTCEIKMVVCPQGNHVCLHGSKCTQGGNGKNASCDCEAGSSSFEMLAGKFCEYKSTTLCNSGSHFSFCVNDGECVVSSDDESERYVSCHRFIILVPFISIAYSCILPANRVVNVRMVLPDVIVKSFAKVPVKMIRQIKRWRLKTKRKLPQQQPNRVVTCKKMLPRLKFKRNRTKRRLYQMSDRALLYQSLLPRRIATRHLKLVNQYRP